MEAQRATVIPPRKGRKSVYPFSTMDVGEFVFLPEKKREPFDTYVYHRGAVLKRKFAIRQLRMRRDTDGAWEEAPDDDPNGVQGIAVYRTE